MRIPRDLSGADLIKALSVFGYQSTRQCGSHLRLSTTLKGEHHLTVPLHTTLRLGTISAVVRDVAKHMDFSKDDVIARLFQR